MEETHRLHPGVTGLRQTQKAVAGGQALRVFLAKDADPALTEPIRRLCLPHRCRLRRGGGAEVAMTRSIRNKILYSVENRGRNSPEIIL